MRHSSLFLAIVIAGLPRIAESQDVRPKVRVSAQSELRVSPDEAIVRFAIVTTDKQILAAKSQNDELANAVVKVVKAQSIDAGDFKVTGLEVGPKYENYRTFIGYEIDRSFQIRTKDFEKIDPIISGLVEAVGDNLLIHELKLQVADQRKHQTEARRLAVQYAHEKARHLAELNQMRLGTPISISEDVEYNSDAGGFGGAGAMPAAQLESQSTVAAADRSQRAHSAIQLVGLQQTKAAPAANANADQQADKEILSSPGQVSLNATVTIEFELIPTK